MLHLSTVLLLAASSRASQEPVPAPSHPETEPWTWSINAFTLDPPDDDAYVMTTVRADHGALHLEGRYNYEDIDTGSLWVGRNYSWEGDVEILAVPMIGAVFGETEGVALGAELDAAWQRLALYVESEYLFDSEDSDESFLYAWSELTFSALDWLYFGLAGQRTRAYQTDLEVDRGLVLGIEREALSLSVYWFNPDRDDSYGALSVGFSM
jgi:hypothetical protein